MLIYIVEHRIKNIKYNSFENVVVYAGSTLDKAKEFCQIGVGAWYCAPGSRYEQVATQFYPAGAIWKYLCPSLPTAVGAVLGGWGS